uniref:Uncharacterized protein n=1 Tax=Oryza brachyantha TaxID=4533 RepID=J3M8K7_ORYBR
MASMLNRPMTLKVTQAMPRSSATKAFQVKWTSETRTSGDCPLMSASCAGRVSASLTAAASTRHPSAPAVERFSTPGGRPAASGNGYVAMLTTPLAAGPCRWRADRTTETLAGVTAMVGSTASGLAAARRTARSVKGPMWLLAKNGMSRMRSFLLPGEAISYP